MIIAQRLQTSNRAEYLLYMWQVEDLIRANGCDIDRLRSNYLARFELADDERKATEEWYAQLCDMMRQEQKSERGHLQINRNVVEGLAELHHRIIASDKFPYYRQMYYKVLPYLVELRAKDRNANTSSQQEESGVASELERCFEVLYGVMMLRLQKREISAETESAAKDVSAFLGQLSDYWKAERESRLEL